MYNIIINTKFSAVHCWSACPIKDVDFLRNYHRHEFHVQVKKNVFHDDRDVEFIDLKNKIETYIRKTWDKKNIGETSCEQLCKKLSDVFDLNYVRVLEDNENGAEYRL